jgi:hypothetical protein
MRRQGHHEQHGGDNQQRRDALKRVDAEQGHLTHNHAMVWAVAGLIPSVT